MRCGYITYIIWRLRVRKYAFIWRLRVRKYRLIWGLLVRKYEPGIGIEPMTDGLQNRCTTAVLSRLIN